MSRRLHGERGQILQALALGGVMIALLGGGLYVGANYLAATHQNDRPLGPPVTAVALENVTSYPPPSDPFKRRCYDRVSQDYHLSYGKNGWDMTDYARPKLSGNSTASNVEADQKLKRDWSAALTARVNDAAISLQKCDSNGDVGGGTKTNTEDAVKEWSGSWVLEKDGPSDGFATNEGPCPLPTRLTVTFGTQPTGPPIATFSFSGASSEATPAAMTGRQSGEYHYDMEDATDRPAYRDYRVSIDLVAESGKNVLAGRIANGGVEFPCSFTFHGHR